MVLRGITIRTLNKWLRRVGVPSILTSAVEAHGDYVKTTNGAQTLMASVAYDRVVLLICEATEAFANGNGAQTTFTVGQTGTADKFAAAAVFTGAALHAKFVLAGTLSSGAALLVTANDASGTGTGGLSVTALAMPATKA